MTPDDVRATAEQLVSFHEQFAPLFGKEPAQDHAYTYLTGLMACPERKSIEPRVYASRWQVWAFCVVARPRRLD